MTAIEKTKATKPEPYRIKADERPERYALRNILNMMKMAI